jgi:HSP20 family protein
MGERRQERMESKRWDPFREVGSIRDEIDRVLDSFLDKLPIRKGRDEPWHPLVDLEESKDKILVRAELPGLKKKDIKISISGDNLTLQGERELKKEEQNKTYHRIERSYGRFERIIPLPTEVEIDKIKATYDNGVLHISLPKSEKVKPKKISIDIS